MRKNLNWLILATAFMLGIAMAGVGTASPALPVIRLEPRNSTAEVGKTFTVDIVVADISEEESLYGWECRITFDRGIINAVNATEGPFLKDTGYETWWLTPTMNNTVGTIDVGALLMPSIEWNGFPPNGAVGSGTLATVTFKAVGNGPSGLDFEQKKDTELYTVIGETTSPIYHTAENGSFSNAGPPIPISLIAGVIVAVVICIAAVLYFWRKRASTGA